jgi:hypothetical protein
MAGVDPAIAKNAVIDKLVSAGYDPQNIKVVEKAKDVYHATVKLPAEKHEFHGIFTAEDLGLV